MSAGHGVAYGSDIAAMLQLFCQPVIDYGRVLESILQHPDYVEELFYELGMYIGGTTLHKFYQKSYDSFTLLHRIKNYIEYMCQDPIFYLESVRYES